MVLIFYANKAIARSLKIPRVDMKNTLGSNPYTFVKIVVKIVVKISVKISVKNEDFDACGEIIFRFISAVPIIRPDNIHSSINSDIHGYLFSGYSHHLNIPKI